MKKDDLQDQIRRLIDDAARFAHDELAPMRVKMTEYYQGRPFGNEEAGRSQFVITEVRDSVLSVIPDIIRVVFGAENVVEFAPRTAEHVEHAAQATDAIRYVFESQGDGMRVVHSVLKDALIRQLGVAKWFYEEPQPRGYKLRGLTQENLEALAAEPGVELERIWGTAEGLFSAHVKHTPEEGRLRIHAIPPEEFLYDREARSLEDAALVAHQTEKREDELLALGVSQSDLDEHGGTDRDLSEQDLLARTGLDASTQRNPEYRGSTPHLYTEAYVRLDHDNDGVPELRLICTIGPGHYIVKNEPVDERPFAMFCPDPEPHTMRGQSWAERSADLQLAKSSVFRAMADSLSASIFPRIAFAEGKVSVEDLLNTEVGAPIRVKSGVAPSQAIQELRVSFTGREALPVLEYLDEVAERRTGRNKGVIGLDADALQSTTAGAVNAAVNASQAQAELLVRLFAEQFLKPMFMGLLRLFVRSSLKTQMMRLRGRWVEVDPRAWDADMQVVVNVCMGSGDVDRKVLALQGIAAKQEMILQTLGPMNPVSTLAQYANTLRDLVELAGRKDTARYFGEVPPDWQPPPPAPDEAAQAEMEFVKVQAAKAQMDAQAKVREAQIQAEKIRAETEGRVRELLFMAESERQKRMLEALDKDKDRAVKYLEIETDARLKERELDIKEKDKVAP